jgi:hypothetical protein
MKPASAFIIMPKVQINKHFTANSCTGIGKAGDKTFESDQGQNCAE